MRFSCFPGWLAWIFIHIMLLISFGNRLIITLQYAWTFLTYQRSSTVILPVGCARKPGTFPEVALYSSLF